MLKFLKETEKTAKSVNEAIAEAMQELNAESEDDVNIEILDEGTKGFLGLGSKDAHVRVSYKDVNAAMAKQFLKSIFDAMKLEVNIDAKTDDEGVKINLSGENMGIVIGKRGDTLDNLQYLTSLIVNQEHGEYTKVILDTENYREKRAEALVALAHRLAEKVARSGKKYNLEPMNPYERRIIHSSLQDNDKVTTFSVGSDPFRKVVIAPKNQPERKRTYKSSHSSSSSYSSSSYASVYSDYKKTAPHHEPIKKAASFEDYQSALENKNAASDETEE